MSKHRLYNSGQESINLNSSRDEANTATPSTSKEKENTNKHSNGAEKNSNPTVQPHSCPKPGAQDENEKTQHGAFNNNVNHFQSRDGSVCESDSDSMDEADFFSRGNSNVKLPYTLQEDEFIIKFVLKGQNIFRASSVSLWKYLETKKDNPKRTYQSLKNRFLKSIKPRLFTTYNYLIKDKETENIILEKYPDLKKKGVRKDVFSALNLPKRPHIMNISDDEKRSREPVAPTGASNSSNQNQNNKTTNNIDERNLEQRKTRVSDTQNRNIESNFEFTHSREVTLEKGSALITVKFKKKVAKKSSTPPVGIYSKFLALKNQNKLVPCPTCSRLGYKVNDREKNPDKSDSDSDNDNFIPNSVETPSQSNSKTPPGSDRVRRSLPSKKLSQKSPSNPNLQKSKTNSKEGGATQKNSNQRDSQNRTTTTKGGKTVSANSNSSKELRLLLEDSRILLKKMFPNDKKKISSISNCSQQQQQIGLRSQTQAPPSQNLRKSVRKSVVKKVSNDVKISNIATRKQPQRNVDTAKPTTATTTATTTPATTATTTTATTTATTTTATTTATITTVTAEGSSSKPSGRPHLERRAKKSNSNSGHVKKPTKRSKANLKLPLRIATLTHRERFMLRKILRRSYRIYRRDLLENKKRSKAIKKRNLKRKRVNREQKNTNSKSQSESDSLNDNYVRSLYNETVSKYRKLANSDEEEGISDQARYNTRRQSVVNNDQSINNDALKSFFLESESESLSSSFTQKSKSDFEDSATSSLADNMMKMLSRF